VGTIVLGGLNVERMAGADARRVGTCGCLYLDRQFKDEARLMLSCDTVAPTLNGMADDARGEQAVLLVDVETTDRPSLNADNHAECCTGGGNQMVSCTLSYDDEAVDILTVVRQSPGVLDPV
jgi:hypothetical protein